MLSQIKHLTSELDGRYATDSELQFIEDYTRSYTLRLETYQRLQEAESEIVQQVLARMKRLSPNLFYNGREDMTAKWKRDTLRVLRYSATAMLLSDPETLRERFLLWFQTIMRAFGAQRSCEMTYQVMQQVVQQHLSADQAHVFCPVLELNRQVLGVN
ncbi:phycobilisome protein [Leptolyngbya sp. AN02str]|uniref:phycobilisome protein n=1 Tax=Leptolyngbya sp. AN02str TaxID=3423363 RepID=UPI003D31CB95